MIFFVDNDGTITNSFPSPVYQGSAGANDIYLIAPFAVNLQAAVAFKLPNGVWTERYPMAQVNEITGAINKKTGKPYVGWQFSLPNEITQYFGAVTAQFFFYTADTGIIFATASTNFTVGKGVPEILPAAPDKTVYDLILNNLSAIQQQLDNGIYAARAIYAYNTNYRYSANELVFYPDKGEYGIFLKSLAMENDNPPYTAEGLNSGYWKEITDFNILNGLYGLKIDAEQSAATATEQATAAANSAAKAATSEQNAADSAAAAENAKQSAAASALTAENWAEIAKQWAGYGIKINTEYTSLEDLPNPGDSHFIYLIPNGSTGDNSYDEYIWTGGKAAYEKIGSTEIDLTAYATKALLEQELAEINTRVKMYRFGVMANGTLNVREEPSSESESLAKISDFYIISSKPEWNLDELAALGHLTCIFLSPANSQMCYGTISFTGQEIEGFAGVNIEYVYENASTGKTVSEQHEGYIFQDYIGSRLIG